MKIANVYRPGYVFSGSEWVPFIGPVGPPGASIRFMGEVKTAADLPAVALRQDGQGWVIADTGHLWVWHAADHTWSDCGVFKGPKGDPGQTIKIDHFIADLTHIPPTPALNEAVFDAQTGHIFVFEPGTSASDGTHTIVATDGTTTVTIPRDWVDMGKIAGPQGPQGIQGVKGDIGASPTFLPSVASAAALPATANPGDIIITDNDGHAHSWNAVSSTWVDVGLLRVPGAAAHPGPEVALVTDFASITGVAGEWRLCEENAHVYGWNVATNTWDDAGKMKVVPDGVNDMDLLTWDVATGTWVTAVNELGDETNVSMSATADGGTFIYDDTNNTFDVRQLKMEDIEDGPGGITPQVGQALVWEGSYWEPQFINSPILFLGEGALTVADVTDETANFGMPANTVPSPAVYNPMAGDQYMDLLTGTVTAFTGPGGSVTRRGDVGSAATGTAAATRDIDLADLNDVAADAPADGDVLTWNATVNMWAPAEPQAKNSPTVFIGSGAPDATKSNVKADNYGLPLGTQPNPQTRAPRMGDTYVDAVSGKAYEVIGHTGADVGLLHLLADIAATVHSPAAGVTIDVTRQGDSIALAQNPPVGAGDHDYTRDFTVASPLALTNLGPGLSVVVIPAGTSATYSYTFMSVAHTVTPSTAATLDYAEIRAAKDGVDGQSLSFVMLSQAAYDALAVKDTHVLYLVTG